jgi:hypothetical protein
MRAFTIKAKTRESAQSLFEALRRFDPALGGSSRDGYFVSVDVGGNDSRILEVLDAVHEHVEKGHSLTRVEMDVAGAPPTRNASRLIPPTVV